MKTWAKTIQNEKGMALVLSILIMASMSIFGIMLAMDNTVEMRISSNQRVTEEAFRNAESGLEHARQKLSKQFMVHMGTTGGAVAPNWNFLLPDDDSAADVINSTEVSGKYEVTAGYANGIKGMVITLHSTGFGPGGAEQEVEVNMKIEADESKYTSYAQEGGGSAKTNVNLADQNPASTGTEQTSGQTIR